MKIDEMRKLVAQLDLLKEHVGPDADIVRSRKTKELLGGLVESISSNEKENVLLKKVIELMNENVSAQWERQQEQEVFMKARMTDCEDRVRDLKKRVKELRAQIIEGVSE